MALKIAMVEYAKGLVSLICQSGCIRPLDLDAVNRLGTVSLWADSKGQIFCCFGRPHPADQAHFDLIYVSSKPLSEMSVRTELTWYSHWHDWHSSKNGGGRFRGRIAGISSGRTVGVKTTTMWRFGVKRCRCVCHEDDSGDFQSHIRIWSVVMIAFCPLNTRRPMVCSSTISLYIWDLARILDDPPSSWRLPMTNVWGHRMAVSEQHMKFVVPKEAGRQMRLLVSMLHKAFGLLLGVTRRVSWSWQIDSSPLDTGI